MAEIQVHAPGGDYAVYVGRMLLGERLRGVLQDRDPRKLVVVSNPNIIELQGRRLMDAVLDAARAEKEVITFAFPEGEEFKNLKTLEEGYLFLLEREVTREDTILAFGGGVVGDLAGYLASSYQRGMSYIQIPTTLMAMVDSSIGGKVGVDLPGAKNAVGAFYQPEAVICDVEVLGTLPEREFRSGLAEVAKYGFLYDDGLLREVERWTAGMPEPGEDLAAMVERCAEHKARVVSMDERDLTGERAILNYGHTFGHALESSTGYRLLLHGEAVALGMMMAAKASELAGMAGSGLVSGHRKTLLPLMKGLRIPGDLDTDRVLRDMKTDKKRGREIRFVLLERPQRPRLVDSLPEWIVKRALEEVIDDLKGG